MTLLSGRCHLTDQSTGKSHELGAGDSLFMPDGRRVTWEIIQEVTKVFLGINPADFKARSLCRNGFLAALLRLSKL
jgi:ethanolamine utilization protein EutQ (cupin superfamily)